MGGLETHAEGFLHDIEHADAATIDERLHIDEARVVDGDVARAPALETVMVFGLGRGPCGGGFGFQEGVR